MLDTIKETLQKAMANAMVKITGIAIVILVILAMISYRSYVNVKADRDTYKADRDMYKAQIKRVNFVADSLLQNPPDTIIMPNRTIRGDNVINIKEYGDSIAKSVRESLYKEKYSEPSEDYSTYVDSIINDSINIRFEIKANELFAIKTEYKPIYKYQEKIVRTNVPYPVEVAGATVPQGGFFMNAGLGYNKTNGFSTKFGAMILFKKGSTINYDIVIGNGSSSHFISYGIKIGK